MGESEPSKTTRSRYHGSIDDMADAICLVAKVPEFITYDLKTDAKAGKTFRLQKRPIQDSRLMWAALTKLQGNLSFSKTQWGKALRKTAGLQKDTWPVALSVKETNGWVEVLQARLQTQQGHLQLALKKHAKKPTKQSAWLDKMFEGEPMMKRPAGKVEGSKEESKEASKEEEAAKEASEEASKDEEEEASEASEEEASNAAIVVEEEELDDDAIDGEEVVGPIAGSEDEWMVQNGSLVEKFYYGYCRELKQAWRALASTPEKKEFSMNLLIGDAKRDDDFVMARFPDGRSAVIQDLTVAELRAMRLAELEKPGALVEQHHKKSGHRYYATYVKRDDRITIWKTLRVKKDNNKKQKCMVVIGWFREESDESNCVGELSNARADMLDKAMCPPVAGGRGC